MNVGPNTHLEVLDYFPGARNEPYSEAAPEQEGAPAVKVQLSTPFLGQPLDTWLMAVPDSQASDWGHEVPVLTEILGTCPPELLPEFLHPPASVDLGKKGILALHFEGKTHRYPVVENFNKEIRLGTTGCIEDNALQA